MDFLMKTRGVLTQGYLIFAASKAEGRREQMSVVLPKLIMGDRRDRCIVSSMKDEVSLKTRTSIRRAVSFDRPEGR
jgi:hypothetical protein